MCTLGSGWAAALTSNRVYNYVSISMSVRCPNCVISCPLNATGCELTKPQSIDRTLLEHSPKFTGTLNQTLSIEINTTFRLFTTCIAVWHYNGTKHFATIHIFLCVRCAKCGNYLPRQHLADNFESSVVPNSQCLQSSIQRSSFLSHAKVIAVHGRNHCT